MAGARRLGWVQHTLLNWLGDLGAIDWTRANLDAPVSAPSAAARRAGRYHPAFGFHLRGEDGTVIGNLGVVNGGDGVSLVLSDHQGHRRINLLVDTDGTPSMQFFDADGNVTWTAP